MKGAKGDGFIFFARNLQDGKFQELIESAADWKKYFLYVCLDLMPLQQHINTK